jgi:hypothetical protein
MIARNAEPIVAARKRGMKPSEMICISLVGTLCNANHVTHADPAKTYDWRWVRDLDVCVYVGPSMNWPATLKAIALCRPSHLSLWNAYEHWGAKVFLVPTQSEIEMCKPVSQWTYELDFLSWMDFQNDDFLAGRSYARAPEGVPYAVNS